MLSCSATTKRAVPSSLGLLLWPAAGNSQHVDLLIAPLAICQTLIPAAACATSSSVVGADGITRFVVGTAAAFHMEAAEELTCSSGSGSYTTTL